VRWAGLGLVLLFTRPEGKNAWGGVVSSEEEVTKQVQLLIEVHLFIYTDIDSRCCMPYI
jgi:hypothetical protein